MAIPASAGIAQVGPAGDPILLPTPALQTNFSPASLAFWKVVYAEMAAIQAAAGLQPYLQFGEVQWWYFPNDGLGTNFSGMPFYDAWNLATFAALYGHPLATITVNTVDPAAYPDEVGVSADRHRQLHRGDHEFRARRLSRRAALKCCIPPM